MRFPICSNGSHMGPDRPGMGPEHSQTLLGHFWGKAFSAKDNQVWLENSFCKSRSHIAVLANPCEAKCSYFDFLFCVFPPQPNQNL